MDRREITARFKALLVLELGIGGSAARHVKDDASFTGDLGADSLDMAALPRAIEDEFGIKLSDDECAFAQTVGTAIDLIETKLENRNCGGSR